MSAFVQDINIDQGADFALTTPAYTVNGAIQDFTGAHCRMMIRVAPADIAPLLSLTDTPTASGSVVANTTAGTVTITVKKVATAALPATQPILYDVFVDRADGTSVRIISGRMFVAASITH